MKNSPVLNFIQKLIFCKYKNKGALSVLKINYNYFHNYKSQCKNKEKYSKKQNPSPHSNKRSKPLIQESTSSGNATSVTRVFWLKKPIWEKETISDPPAISWSIWETSVFANPQSSPLCVIFILLSNIWNHSDMIRQPLGVSCRPPAMAKDPSARINLLSLPVTGSARLSSIRPFCRLIKWSPSELTLPQKTKNGRE